MREPKRLSAGLVGLLLAVSVTVQPLCGKGKTTPWDSQYKVGCDALKSGDYGEARRSLAMALESTKTFHTSDPRLGETYYALGQLYLGDQEYSQAKEYFNRALMVEQSIPGYDELKLADTLFGLATASEMLGDREMAVVLLKRVRDIWTKVHGSHSPKLIGVLKPLGIYATVNSDYKVAEDCYRQVVAIEEQSVPQNADLGSSLNLLASTLTRQGKLDEASRYAERAVKLLGNAADSAGNKISAESAKDTLAYVRQEMGLGNKNKEIQIASNPVPSIPIPPVKAAPRTTDVIASNPATNPDVVTRSYTPPTTSVYALPRPATTPPPSTPILNAAKVETKVTAKIDNKTETKAAIGAPKTSVATSSTEFRPWELTNKLPDTTTASNPGDDSGKIRYLAGGKLITKEEYDAMLLANEAYELIKTEKYKMACDILKRALNVAPNLASAHTNLGLALTQLGETDAAIDHLKQAIAIDPSRSAPWLNLASAFQLSGQLKSSLVTYSEYAHRFPNEPLAKKATAIAEHLEKEVKEQSAIAGDTTNTGPDYFAYASHEGPVRWADQAHIKVYVAPASNVPSYKSEYEGFCQEAFKQWSTASKDKLAFDFVKSPDNADIEWVWTEDEHKVSSPAEGGETNVSYNGKKIRHATIVVLTKNPSTEGPLSANQIRAVSLHEIGHALGLIGHSPKPQDIMFCSMPPAVAKPTLSPRDVNTIDKLYSMNVSYLKNVSRYL